MKKTILILLAILSLSACSTFDRVFPSTRDEYKRAEALPDLEIPPDLTRDAINNSMAIPGENSSTQGATTDAPAQKLAQMQVINGKNIVTIPEEFTIAWTRIEQTLIGSGMTIDAKDQTKGTFDITYKDESEKGGWFGFLRDREDSYVVSMSGVGDKTELVVLDEDGEWKPTEESGRILSTIMTQYNISRAK